jgi:hypothetical protein
MFKMSQDRLVVVDLLLDAIGKLVVVTLWILYAQLWLDERTQNLLRCKKLAHS